MGNKVWLVTGVSSGFGAVLVDEIVASGDAVVGTLRSASQVEAFNARYAGKATAVQMDVTNPAQVRAGVAAAIAAHGRIDVLVNNAGYAMTGAVEETSLDEFRAQLEANVFGVISVTQAVLPHMRAARSGCIVQMSSVAGIRGINGMGAYNASKFALEGLSEALAMELAPLGIKVTLVEPGPYRTKFADSSMKRAAAAISDYAETAHAFIDNYTQNLNGKQYGDPAKACRVIIQAVASGAPPLHLPMGKGAIARIRQKMAAFEADIQAWEAAVSATDCDDVAA